jgi:3-dehydroquinate synthase
MATTVRIDLGERSYDIEIGHGNLAGIASFITKRRKCTHAVIITDDNVKPRYADAIAGPLRAAGIRPDVLTVPAGEASKSVAQAERLWNDLLGLGADRKTVIVALGGGVVGDLAGFAAATYGRGLALVQIPTTLLAQVDSSVGGKVGVNLPAAKNIVGAFWQPAGVLIDLGVLQTLPDREYHSGLAEVVKYGVILDSDLFAYLEANVDGLNARERSVLEHIVATSCRLKAQIVQQDEREESGLRAVLNYGHTFCHAIESVAGYGHFLHGEAVAIGMVCASRLAELLGRTGADVIHRQQALLERLRLPITLPALDENQLLAAMARDKKAEHGRLRFVLPTQIGHVEVVGDVDPAVVKRVLQFRTPSK